MAGESVGSNGSAEEIAHGEHVARLSCNRRDLKGEALSLLAREIIFEQNGRAPGVRAWHVTMEIFENVAARYGWVVSR